MINIDDKYCVLRSLEHHQYESLTKSYIFWIIVKLSDKWIVNIMSETEILIWEIELILNIDENINYEKEI